MFFKNELKKRIKNEKGLTLIELLAVIVILAIVAAIAIPAIGNIIENSRIKAVKSDAINIINSANMYYSDGNTTTFASTATGTDLTTIESYIGSDGSIVTYSVSEDLKITGTAVKNNVKLTFTGATIENIKSDTADLDGTFVKATP